MAQSWIGRAITGLQRLIGIGRRAEVPPAAPPQQPPPVSPAPPPREDVTQPMPVPEYWGTGVEEHEVTYVERQGGTLGRWEVEDPNLYDVRNVMNAAGYQTDMIIVICGIPCTDYPGKGPGSICLSYKFNAESVQDSLDDPDARTSEDWINNIVSEWAYGNCWEQIYSIQVVDWGRR